MDDEINFRECFLVLWRRKIYVGSFTAIMAIVTIFYVINLPNIYQSKAIFLPPKSGKSGMTAMLSQISSIPFLSIILIPFAETVKETYLFSDSTQNLC